MHRWIVFITGYLVTFLNSGLVFSIGNIFVDIMRTFNATRAETAVIHSTALAVGPGAGILAGVLIPVFGVRKCGIIFSILVCAGNIFSYFATTIPHMIITFGIVHGLGFTNVFICAMIAISQHFTGRQRLFLLSVHASSAGSGGMVQAYLLPYLSSRYGFRGALLIIGGICLNTVPCCLVWTEPFRGLTQRKNHNSILTYETEYEVKVTGTDTTVITKTNSRGDATNDIFYIRKFPVLPHLQTTRRVSICQEPASGSEHPGDNDSTHSFRTRLKMILKNRYFAVFWSGSAIVLASISITLIFLTDIFLDKDFSEKDAILGIILLNIFNIIGRLMPGVLMQIKRAPVLIGPLLATLMATFVMVGLIVAKSKWMALSCVALLGVPFGMSHSMLSVVTASLVGINILSTATGLIVTTLGIFNAIAGPISGYVRDTYGSYNSPYYVATSLTGLWALLYVFALIQRRKRIARRRRRSSLYYLTSM